MNVRRNEFNNLLKTIANENSKKHELSNSFIKILNSSITHKQADDFTRAIKSNNNFTILNLNDVKIKKIKALVQPLKDSNIEVLELQTYFGHSANAEEIKELAPALKGGKIRWIDLSYSFLQSKGAKALALALQDSNVEVLIIPSCCIGDEGVKALVPVLKWSSIQRLDLSCNSLGDDGARELVPLLKNSEIKWINLQNNQIHHGVVIELIEDNTNSNTIEILLEHNKIDDEGAVLLAENTNNNSKIKISLTDNKVFQKRLAELNAPNNNDRVIPVSKSHIDSLQTESNSLMVTEQKMALLEQKNAALEQHVTSLGYCISALGNRNNILEQHAISLGCRLAALERQNAHVMQLLSAIPASPFIYSPNVLRDSYTALAPNQPVYSSLHPTSSAPSNRASTEPGNHKRKNEEAVEGVVNPEKRRNIDGQGRQQHDLASHASLQPSASSSTEGSASHLTYPPVPSQPFGMQNGAIVPPRSHEAGSDSCWP